MFFKVYPNDDLILVFDFFTVRKYPEKLFSAKISRSANCLMTD
jgi:hypothetical protein